MVYFLFTINIMMRTAQLIHNPGAGDGILNKELLIGMVESKGFKCLYTSTKEKGWEIDPAANFAVAAGGDGTVRKIARRLIKKDVADRIPIAVLPMGTANNISKAINGTEQLEAIIAFWQEWNTKAYDIGYITGVKATHFFIEGVGMGVFPNLMDKMKQKEDDAKDADDAMTLALSLLNKITASYKTHKCRLFIDGIDHSGEYLLLEIMNTSSLGPNLSINPSADTGDGLFEVLLITEEDRDNLAAYIGSILKDEEKPFQQKTIKGKNIELKWEGARLHVDDELIKVEKPVNIQLSMQNSALQFLTPGHSAI
jgi:diacylglycerol kinase (ATP)